MAAVSTAQCKSRFRSVAAEYLEWLIREKVRVVRIAIALPLFFVTIEVCARLDDLFRYDAPLFCDYNYNDMLYTQDEHGRRGRPNGRFEKWQLNSHGFRSPEIRIEKPPGVTRIACVGASETFGYAESPGGEWPARLQAMLDIEYPGRYEVINTAIAGYLLSSNTTNLRHRILKLSPNMVILYQVFFDYLDPKREPARERSPSPARVPPVREDVRTVSLKPRCLRKAKPIVKSMIPQPILRIYQIRKARALLARVRERAGYDTFVNHVPPESLAQLETDMRHFQELCEDSNAQLLLATQAFHWDEYTRPEALRYMPYLDEDGLTSICDSLNKWLLGYGADNHIPCVDIARAVPPDSEHMADYVHLTDEGARLVAEAMAQAVIALDTARSFGKG